MDSVKPFRKTTVTPLAVTRSLRQMGTHIATWRKLQRITTAQLAERAGISKDTLRSIEQGKGTASTENLFRVLRITGILDKIVTAADPYQTDVGRLRADEILPQRVRGDR
ncbi:MAG TPA: helix-turn-helix transcriptional regulator [Streptosporangiaceae bacterium]